MPENVFKEKEDYLINAKADVDKRDAMAAELEKLRNQVKRLNKSIAVEEKSISDEIASTIKKRKQEISDTYDERLDDNRARKKKVSNKRDKKKNQRMNQRIQDETKHIRDNNRDLEVEMKTLLKKNKVPSYCDSGLYYVMFMPRGLDEVLLMLLSFLVYFAGIPCGVMLLIKHFVLDKKGNINIAFWCVLIVAIIVVVQLIIYFIIFNATKIKHHDIVLQTRSIRDKTKANKRQMSAIRNSINKDKDESSYNLGAYDEKLANLDEEADNIGNEKQDALKLFEDETKQLIIDEINSRRLQTVEDMKAEKKSVEKKISNDEKKYSDMVLHITNQYASYIGEDLCKSDKLSDLITLMEEGQAETVSEAISVYKGQSQKSSK
ncbi:MAG: hypothetical protein ACI4D8_07245 [Wujia sp.]